MLRIVCLLALGLVQLTGCSTASRFHSTPMGAKLFINGDYIGETPIVYDDAYSLPKRLHVQLQKDGYEELDMYLDKQMSYPMGAGIANPYFFAMTFWAWKLDNDYRFDLTSLKKTEQVEAAPAPVAPTPEPAIVEPAAEPVPAAPVPAEPAEEASSPKPPILEE